jgi:hypothetical protein
VGRGYRQSDCSQPAIPGEAYHQPQYQTTLTQLQPNYCVGWERPEQLAKLNNRLAQKGVSQMVDAWLLRRLSGTFKIERNTIPFYDEYWGRC